MALIEAALYPLHHRAVMKSIEIVSEAVYIPDQRFQGLASVNAMEDCAVNASYVGTRLHKRCFLLHCTTRLSMAYPNYAYKQNVILPKPSGTTWRGGLQLAVRITSID